MVADGAFEGGGCGWVWVLDWHAWQGEGIVAVDAGALAMVEVDVAEGEVEAFVSCGTGDGGVDGVVKMFLGPHFHSD